GAVEAQALAEGVFGQFTDRQGEMLPGAEGIHELHVHHLRPLLPGLLQDLPGGAHAALFFLCFHGLLERAAVPVTVPTRRPAQRTRFVLWLIDLNLCAVITLFAVLGEVVTNGFDFLLPAESYG